MALQGLVFQFESQFAAIAAQLMEEERMRENGGVFISGTISGGWRFVNHVPLSSSAGAGRLTRCLLFILTLTSYN